MNVLNYVGKLLGGIAGLAVGGPIGGIIGVIAGHAYDLYRRDENRTKRRRRSAERQEKLKNTPGAKPLFDDPTETRRIAFATAIIVLGAKLAKADGVVSRDEILAFKRRFRISDHQVGGIAHIYDQAKKTAAGFEPYARQIATLFGHDAVMLEELLIGLFEVARADRDLQVGEIEFLREVATIFGFDDEKFEQIRATFGATQTPLKAATDAYKILGITRSTPDAEIKKIHRKLVRELHPDRLTAKGMPEEFVKRSSNRLAAINGAFDMIAKERNLK